MIIRHFPYRWYAQYERNIARGSAAYARNVTLPRAIGDGWREMYDRLRAGVLPSWYATLPHADDPELDEWINRGKVVEDTRLADYLGTIDDFLSLSSSALEVPAAV